MGIQKRFLASAGLGITIAVVGFLCPISGIDVLVLLNLVVNWHLVLLISRLLPFLDWELSPPGVVVFALILPAIEWTLIVFGIGTLAARLRQRATWRIPKPAA